MEFINEIEQKLYKSLNAEQVEIRNDSELHRHHMHNEKRDAEIPSHLTVTIVSEMFDGIPRVKRHKMVYAILEDEMRDHIHALALKTLTVAEAKK